MTTPHPTNRNTEAATVLPMLKQVVLMQSFIDRPIMADSPRWYMDPKMKAQRNLPAAPNVPDWIVAQREDINDDMLSKLGIEYNENEDYSEYEQEFEGEAEEQQSQQ